MTQKEIEKLAIGHQPWLRCKIPGPGERCPRCHGYDRTRACLLCNPAAVPAANFAPCETCEMPTGVACVALDGKTVVEDHLPRRNAKARALAVIDRDVLGVGFERHHPDGRIEHIPAAQVMVHRRTPT